MPAPDQSTTASLGCGSLILIAIIVLIFGNRGSDEDLKREVRDLRSEVKELKATIVTQSATLNELRQAILNSKPPTPERLPE